MVGVKSGIDRDVQPTEETVQSNLSAALDAGKSFASSCNNIATCTVLLPTLLMTMLLSVQLPPCHLLSLTKFHTSTIPALQQLSTCTECIGAPLSATENRVFLISDMQPNNAAETSALVASLESASSSQKIFATVVAVGLDFDSQVTEAMSSIPGFAYFSVHSPRE